MGDVTDPAERAISFLAFLHAHISDLKTRADMHRYFELQTGIKDKYFGEWETNSGSYLQLANYSQRRDSLQNSAWMNRKRNVVRIWCYIKTLSPSWWFPIFSLPCLLTMHYYCKEKLEFHNWWHSPDGTDFFSCRFSFFTHVNLTVWHKTHCEIFNLNLSLLPRLSFNIIKRRVFATITEQKTLLIWHEIFTITYFFVHLENQFNIFFTK